jgi:hypothetical protein
MKEVKGRVEIDVKIRDSTVFSYTVLMCFENHLTDEMTPKKLSNLVTNSPQQTKYLYPST